MDDKLLSRFRQQLLQRKESLRKMSDTGEQAAKTVELDQTRQGRLSRMDALQGQAMSIAALNRRQLEIKNIDQAIRRIDNEEFGFCESCGEEIAEKRLEVNPTVTCCIHCAAKQEL